MIRRGVGNIHDSLRSEGVARNRSIAGAVKAGVAAHVEDGVITSQVIIGRRSGWRQHGRGGVVKVLRGCACV